MPSSSTPILKGSDVKKFGDTARLSKSSNEASSSTPMLKGSDVKKFADAARLSKSSNEAYLQAYPELNRLCGDIVRACLEAQPSNVHEFIRNYVQRYRPTEEDRGQVDVDLGITGPKNQKKNENVSLELDDE